MLDQSATLEQFLAATAARQPTPGGGAVSALVGALAASLTEMVVNYSIGKKDLAAFDAELKTALAEMTRARQLLCGLMTEDQAAYTALSAAKKLPADAPRRQEIFNAALQACLNAPQAIAASSLAILAICDRIVEKVNPHLLSDLAIAADLATATVRCAIYNVKVNMSELADPAALAAMEDSNHKMLVRALGLIQRVSPAIWNRMAEES
jgi:formiminotetrahydrofolate cyclodeaminase